MCLVGVGVGAVLVRMSADGQPENRRQNYQFPGGGVRMCSADGEGEIAVAVGGR